MKIKYVQLESQAFFADFDFTTMTASERGVYCTLLLHLYCSGGKCEYDPVFLGRLCNCRGFERIWKRIAKKFQTRKGVIRHKRVSKELRRAKKFAQRQRRAGLASARQRQPRLNGGAAEAAVAVEPTKRKRKENEKESEQLTNTNTYERAFSSSSSSRPVGDATEERTSPPVSEVKDVESIGAILDRLGIRREKAGKALGLVECDAPERNEAEAGNRAVEINQGLHFHQALTNMIHPRSRSDRTCFRNVANWMTRRAAEGRFDNETFKMVLGFAEEAKSARNPAAAFMALLKKELRYPNG